MYLPSFSIFLCGMDSRRVLKTLADHWTCHSCWMAPGLDRDHEEKVQGGSCTCTRSPGLLHGAQLFIIWFHWIKGNETYRGTICKITSGLLGERRRFTQFPPNPEPPTAADARPYVQRRALPSPPPPPPPARAEVPAPPPLPHFRQATAALLLSRQPWPWWMDGWLVDRSAASASCFWIPISSHWFDRTHRTCCYYNTATNNKALAPYDSQHCIYFDKTKHLPKLAVVLVLKTPLWIENICIKVHENNIGRLEQSSY